MSWNNFIIFCRFWKRHIWSTKCSSKYFGRERYTYISSKSFCGKKTCNLLLIYEVVV